MGEKKLQLSYGAETSVGKVRDHNEDCWLIDEQLGLFVIADGMGGHEAGEVARRLACDTIRKAVQNGADLVSAIRNAQEEIEQAAARGEGEEGMGTTVVALWTDGNRYRIAWVGDSRAYLWHDGQLRQLTEDHSFVQQLVDNHVISTEEAESHPEKSTLSRCLGGGLDDELEIDELDGSFFSGERIVLCTDGLCGEVSDDDIVACLREFTQETPAKIANELIEVAMAAGGQDNATVIVLEAPPTAPDRIRQTAPRKRIELTESRPDSAGKRKWVGWLIAGLLLVALATALWAWYRASSEHEDVSGPSFTLGTESVHALSATAGIPTTSMKKLTAQGRPHET